MSLTASKILKIRLKAETMWTDSRLAAEYTPYSDTAKAVLRNQTARFSELTKKDKDETVTVTWVDPCGREVEDCESSCDISGPEPSTASQDYALDICKSTSFSINEEVLRTNDYTAIELIAGETALAIKALDEYWSRQLLVKLKAFAGINLYPNGFTYANGTTTIPAAQYNPMLYAYLVKAGILNKMPNTYMIDNGNLFIPMLDARLDGGNADGAGGALRAAEIAGKLTYDMWNFPAAGITEDTFLISPGAVAFKTKTRFDAEPVYLDGKVNQWRYTVNSVSLPGVQYDVISQLTCLPNATTNQEEIVQNFKFITRGGIFQNPKGCPVVVGGTTYTPTGVMSFSQGA